MMMRAIVLLALTAVAFSASSDQMITDFTKVGDGFKDAWEAADPKNVEGDFRSTYAGGKLYVIKQRGEDSPGGIVSSFDPQSYEWTHKSHYLDIGSLKYAIFSLVSRPFMITYKEEKNGKNKIIYLYQWNDAKGEWTDAKGYGGKPIRPFNMDQMLINPGVPYPMYISVPDQEGSYKYMSTIDDYQNPVIFELRVDLGSDKPAIVRKLATIPNDGEGKGIVLTVIKDKSSLLAYARKDSKSGDGSSVWTVYKEYTIDRKTGKITKSSPLYSQPMFFPYPGNDRFFQINKWVIFFGWSLPGHGQNHQQMWVYDMAAGVWKDGGLSLPDGQLVVDQKNQKIFAVDWNQVKVALWL